MKDSQKWAILFTVINVVLISVCCVLLLGKDKKAPVITFSENNLIYYSDMDEGQLLGGVTATDNREGDISDRIVVEKIVQDQEENRVVVYYAVMDRDGNVSKASRVFEAVSEETGDVRKDIGMAGIDEELDAAMQDGTVTDETTEAPSESETEEAAEVEEAGEARTEQDEEAGASENEDEEEARSRQELLEEQRKQEEEQRQREQEEEQQRQAEEEARRVREAEAAAKAGNPKIRLKSTTVNTVAGQLPAWVEVIGSFEDDVDGYETLFRNLKASKYDVNAKGDHSVSLTTTDSDGNASDPVTVTVHVK